MCRGIQPPKYKVAAMAHTIKMLTYSARKNSANFIPEYSVWNPAVSSDSASARSKGARLVSAVTAMMNMTKEMIAGICPLKSHQPSCWEVMMSEIRRLPVSTTMEMTEIPADNS